MDAAPQDLQRLDELLTLIHRCSPADEAKYADEHVHGARTCLLGAMPAEFGLNLELAKETLARMTNTEARREAQKILAGLTAPQRHFACAVHPNSGGRYADQGTSGKARSGG